MAEAFDWSVFPVGADKRPFPGTRGFKDATTNVLQIRAAFAKRPGANVGVATGKVSGIFVIDVDVKDVGLAGLESFEQKYGKLPATRTARTPSGGLHYYYAYPENVTIRCATNLDGLKIDIRGDGGYAVASPSVLAAGPYAWLNEADIAPAPKWLIERLTSNRGLQKQAEPSANDNNGEISEGGRNSALCSIAGGMRRSGATETEIAIALQAVNVTQCRPPLDAAEVEAIARSVARYPQGSRHPATDVGNARRLVEALAGDARYDHASRAWHLFDGTCWRRDGDGAIIRAAKSIGDMLLTDAQATRDPEHRKRRIAFAVRSQSHARISAMVDLARSEDCVPISATDFDKPAHLLNVLNGTIDLRTGKLLAHDRADLLARTVDIEFDPAATCPNFERFVSEIFDGDEELIEFIHRVMGYAATGETREQMFLVFHGDGANGKSTFLNAISNALGPYAAHTPTETLLVRSVSASNDVARLKGARFVTASEADAHHRLNETFIKQVTGDEPVTARYLYGEFFTFHPVFKLALATNALPAVNGADPALFRRLRLVPFNRVFSAAEQDKELCAKLAAELPGILAWIVRGSVKWYDRGLTTPAAVLHAGAEFRADSDTVSTYIEDRCELATGEVIQASHLFRDYRRFTEDAGRVPLNQTGFGRALTRRGVVADKRGGAAYRVGIKFRPLAA